MKKRAYLYFVATFLVGIILGGAATFLTIWHTGHWRVRFDRQHFIAKMQRELKLSDAQVSQLTQIMNDTDAKFKELRTQMARAFQKLRAESHERIRQILGPEQVVKYNEMLRRHEEKMKRSHPGGTPHPNG